ncbi:MAG: phosphoribosylamine---glycine ligase, partial [Alphaproteobacteria bacterium]|nr:phosphoribosylamine---glycine ligase [Alphaproteobacteria bacterium]
MRFLGIGDYNDLGDLYYRLRQDGHEVRVFVEQAESQEVFQGLVERTPDWRRELNWIRAAGRDGVIVFELASHGPLQDRLRKDGFQVIGGSAYGDRLEADRAFGQRVLRQAGLKTALTESFDDFDRALAFLNARPGRYVLKNDGTLTPSTSSYVGQAEDGADMRALLAAERTRLPAGKRPSFVLMQHVEGVEMGVGAYFNGERFLEPVVIDWEHKRFFPGDLGELTGEMGTLISYRGGERLFGDTLARMAGRLQVGGYVGYINLNTIINEEGVWPLEFTCRFGYPGFAICDALHLEGWDSIFRKMLDGSVLSFETRPGYAVGVVLTVPPFPYEHGYEKVSKGVPILFRADTTDADRRNLHYAEVAQINGVLVASGSIGYLMVANGAADTVEEAQAKAYGLARKVIVPNLR